MTIVLIRQVVTMGGMASTVRVTRQRQAVSDLLAAQDGFRSAQQIHADLRAGGQSVGLATVYRNLGLLVELGELDTVVREDGETLYRRCGRAHHHHLVCRQCGHTVEIAGPAVESWADKVAQQNGFTDVSHSLELMGLCAACAASAD